MAAARPEDVASVRHRPRGTRVGTDAGTVGVVDQPPGYDRPGARRSWQWTTFPRRHAGQCPHVLPNRPTAPRSPTCHPRPGSAITPATSFLPE
ncbi:hypothetical protein EASAB2608_03376 [Streptomyces sp. EAS-AB2608]|nr:hypothetical protein EASAB2608_03376 [Streptomyces sp. EAS-AB2608]